MDTQKCTNNQKVSPEAGFGKEVLKLLFTI
jgi:hypothetical protein